MPDQPIMSAAVMRRLAEAADGFRTDVEKWFVANPDDLRTVYPADSADEAADIRAALLEPEHFAIYGPFVTPLGTRLPGEAHVVSVRVTFSDESFLEVDGTKSDALFWSASALDKFVYPYYAYVLGVDVAAAMKAEESGMTSRDLTDHPTSSYRMWVHPVVPEPGEPVVAG